MEKLLDECPEQTGRRSEQGQAIAKGSEQAFQGLLPAYHY